MAFLDSIDLGLIEFIFFCSVILFASIVRGFSGFGFSASSVSLLSFILPAKEIVPIILLLEIIASFLMIPSIWKKINWKFVVYLLLGVALGTPYGVYLLSKLEQNITHFIISATVLVFAGLLLSGYKNTKLNLIFSSAPSAPSIVIVS